MSFDRETLYLVASGEIESPSLELEVNGHKEIFDGHDARVFAFGVLAGLKIGEYESSDNVTIKNDTKEQ